jgi:CRISPR-associated endonuclease/helicase Cas3
MHYAHTLPGRDCSAWEPLEAHLRLVANGEPPDFPGAAGFASAIGAPEWGRLAGLWHDLGKYSEEFQARLRPANGVDEHLERPGRVDHSTAGARHAVNVFGTELGGLLAFCIAGHHGGMPDVISNDGGSDLDTRLKNCDLSRIAAAPPHIVNQPPPPLPPLVGKINGPFRLAVFVRMLFSCLVDADYLATERFVRPDRAAERKPCRWTLPQLRDLLNTHLQEKFPPAVAADSEVNRRRAEVLAACRAAAEKRPGFFSLTVPTGGGKTLSSLAFALEHAVRHDLRRVIYAIPYTSIIEQTAAVFRTALGPEAGAEAVLEHHSNLDPDTDSGESRLAAENWDSPLIVTTNVQLFESLFSNKPKRCRKLHRIARSVIVLDEAQTMVPDLLAPTLKMLDALVRDYGCTVVLCTATQPAIHQREGFEAGLAGVEEIVPDREGLYRALRRVQVHHLGRTTDAEIADRLAAHRQTLCIVNTRAHAAKLFLELRERGVADVVHLSTRLCAAHRAERIAAIRARLQAGEPCRVVSTQLIEAGVDLDFREAVYRAMAGLDSIAQAAGRCNREGRAPIGQLFVFEPEHAAPRMFARAIQATQEVATIHEDLLSLEAIEHYFRLAYWEAPTLDKHGIVEKFKPSSRQTLPQFKFRTVGDAYRWITAEQTAVVVPYGEEGRRLCERLRTEAEPDRALLRRAQRYGVGVYAYELKELMEEGAVEQSPAGVWVLCRAQAYDEDALGLQVTPWDPGELVL